MYAALHQRKQKKLRLYILYIIRLFNIGQNADALQ